MLKYTVEYFITIHFCTNIFKTSSDEIKSDYSKNYFNAMVQNSANIDDGVSSNEYTDRREIKPNDNYNLYYNNKSNEVIEEWQRKLKRKYMNEPGFYFTPTEMKKFKIWKDGVIPYYIDTVSFNDKAIRDMIRTFLHTVNSATSLSFTELLTPPNDDISRWILFVNRGGLLGCADHSVKNFTNTGIQPVSLGYSCMALNGELAEAVMSIAGVPAQHNAPNRDKYITVNMDNILSDKKFLFKKLRDDEWLFHDLDYDYESITHFDISKHTANGKASIIPRNKYKLMNPPKTFSSTDIMKLKMMYHYLSGKRNLMKLNCSKLFRLRNNFNRRTPKDTLIRSRKKPRRYLDAIGYDEYIEAMESLEAGSENLNYSKEGGDNKNSADVLTLLSDYQTDDDRYRQKLLKVIQENTLHYVNETKLTKLKNS